MKKALIVLLAIFAFCAVAQASDVTLAWDDPHQPTWGTRLYIGLEAGSYLYSHDAGVGVTTAKILNLVPGNTYYFAARHYAGGVQSGLSNEVSYKIASEVEILPGVPVADDSIKTYQITIRKME